MDTRRTYLRTLGTGVATVGVSGCLGSVLGPAEPRCTRQFDETPYLAGQRMELTDARVVRWVASNGEWVTPQEGAYFLLVRFRTEVVDEYASHVPGAGEFALSYDREEIDRAFLDRFVTDGRLHYSYALHRAGRIKESVAQPDGTVVAGWFTFPVPEGFRPAKSAFDLDFDSARRDGGLCWLLPDLEVPSGSESPPDRSAPEFESAVRLRSIDCLSADKDPTILVTCDVAVENTGRAPARVFATLHPESGDWNREGGGETLLPPGERAVLKPYVYLTEWTETMPFRLRLAVDEKDGRDDRVVVEEVDRRIQVIPTDAQ